MYGGGQRTSPSRAFMQPSSGSALTKSVQPPDDDIPRTAGVQSAWHHALLDMGRPTSPRTTPNSEFALMQHDGGRLAFQDDLADWRWVYPGKQLLDPHEQQCHPHPPRPVLADGMLRCTFGP